MLVVNGFKYHIKPCNVESRSVHVVKCENDEAKIAGEMSLHLTITCTKVSLSFSCLNKAWALGNLKYDEAIHYIDQDPV